MALIVGTNSYVTLTEANDYIAESYVMADRWAALTDPQKEAALITAYRNLTATEQYNVAGAEDTIQKAAQCEQGMFVVQEGAALSQRASVRAQGVTVAGVVQETYDGKAPAVPLAPMVLTLLHSVKRDLNRAVTGLVHRDEAPDDDIIEDSRYAR